MGIHKRLTMQPPYLGKPLKWNMMPNTLEIDQTKGGLDCLPRQPEFPGNQTSIKWGLSSFWTEDTLKKIRNGVLLGSAEPNKEGGTLTKRTNAFQLIQKAGSFKLRACSYLKGSLAITSWRLVKSKSLSPLCNRIFPFKWTGEPIAHQLGGLPQGFIRSSV